MNREASPTPSYLTRGLRSEIGLAATTCGLLAAVGYTSANVCLRSVTHLDPVWVSCVKSLPTVLATLPMICLRVFKGQAMFSSERVILMTFAVALFGNLAGNVCFQWSLGVVGLALSVPLMIGTMIISGAVLGHYLLGDPITTRMGWASSILILAIGVLSFGAPAANASMVIELQTSSPLRVLAGVAGACMAGVAYSSLSIVLRYATNQGTAMSALLFTVGAVGASTLGGITWAMHGSSAMMATSGEDVISLLGAGVFNLIAFWGLTKALHLSSVIFVNALNASQTALAAIAGVLLFREPTTFAMGVGVGLTVLGLLTMRGTQPKHSRTRQHDIQRAGVLPK